MNTHADLAAFVCRLSIKSDTTITNQLGEAIQWFFYNQLEKIDKKLTTITHDGFGMKAYAVSELMHWGTTTPIRGHVNHGDNVWFRIVGLNEKIAAALAVILQTQLHETLMINKIPLILNEVVVDHANHAWAGQTNYDELVTYFEARKPPTDFTFRFLTPTTFTRKGLDIPFPTPRLLFGNLERRWRACAPEQFKIGQVFNSFLDYFVVFDDYTLKTATSYLQNSIRLGFTGETTYKIRPWSSQLKKEAKNFEKKVQQGQFNRASSYIESYGLYQYIQSENGHAALSQWMGILYAFSFYAGIGNDTTQGLGLVEINTKSLPLSLT